MSGYPVGVQGNSELVYIYQQGRLTTLAGTVIKCKNKKRLVDLGQCVETKITNYKPSDTQTADGLHVPPSLLNIAINYIADNLELVESLIDFPDIIGKLLFEAAVVRSLGDAGSNSFAITKLFCDAYKEQVLSDLRVNSTAELEVFMVGFGGLCFLTKLDLSGCHIGDDHDILKQISQEFHSLLQLNLADNSLTSAGIAQLTAACRMFKRGPAQLQILNLSRNPYLFDATLKYLHCLKYLQILDLSGSSISENALKKFSAMLLLPHNAKLPISYDASSSLCTTQGWASELFQQWSTKQHKHESVKARSCAEASLNASGFYGKSKRKSTMSSKIMCSNKVVLFVAKPRFVNKTEKETSIKKACDGRIPKNKSFSRISDEELDLYSGYL